MMLAVVSVCTFTSCGKEQRAKAMIEHLFDSIAQSRGETYSSLYFSKFYKTDWSDSQNEIAKKKMGENEYRDIVFEKIGRNYHFGGNIKNIAREEKGAAMIDAAIEKFDLTPCKYIVFHRFKIENATTGKKFGLCFLVSLDSTMTDIKDVAMYEDYVPVE